MMFDRKRRNSALQALQRDLKNYQKLSWSQEKFSLLYFDSLVITKNTMPQLYAYIEGICTENNMNVPVVAITRHKNIFNAFAAKLFVFSGGICIGQDLLKECTDEEIEAIIAHELGHIKHNHVNKILIAKSVCTAALAGLLYRYTNLYRKNNQFGRLSSQDVVIIKLAVTAFLGNQIARLVLGKKFEREADAFACKVGKAKGVAQFFERMEQEKERNDQDFERIRALLNNTNLRTSNDTINFNMRYYIAKIGHKINRAFKWLYHNTRFGAHPSNKERIKKAKEYAASHA